jgi:hypothetical protein
MEVSYYLNRIFSYQFFLVFSLAFVTHVAAAAEAKKTPNPINELNVSTTNIPDFMKIVVMNEGKPPTKEQIAFDAINALNDGMFPIYDKSAEIFKQHFRERHNLIMGLFSGKGGRFLLYRAGQPPIEAESPPAIYRIAKSVGHCAMATYVLVAPYVGSAAADPSWVAEMQAYHTRVKSALEALNTAYIQSEERELLSATLNQIQSFMDKSLQTGSFTYDDVQTYARGMQPNLAKLIALASSTQVGHWYKVLENWKQMLGTEWENTYALSNSIYVSRQNNIIFSVLAQFFGEKAINDRLILLETTDFTTTPEAMLGAFIRIIADRALGKVFFDNYRLMDFELLGGGGRKAIQAEAAKRGLKPWLPPLVPYNSTEWPWKIDPASGTGPALMEDIK